MLNFRKKIDFPWKWTVSRKNYDVALVMQGSALNVCLQYYESEVAELVCACSAVVCCRCSPEQKAQIVQLLKKVGKFINVTLLLYLF